MLFGRVFRLRCYYIFFVSILFVLLFLTENVKAHSTLLESVPGEDALVEESPDKIDLLLNEPVETDLANITIYDWNANPVYMGQPANIGERVPKVTFTIPVLEDGTYTVMWSVVSLDGHAISGSYSFAVGVETEGAVEVVASQSISELPLVIVRTIAQGLIVLLAGLYWFSYLAERRGFPGLELVIHRGKVTALIVLFLAAIAELVMYAFSLPPGLMELIFSGRFDLLLQFPFILMVFAQVVVLLLLVIPGMMRGWYLFIWGILVVIPAFGGHVWGLDNPYVAVIPRIIHQLSMSLWVGALLYVILVYVWQRVSREYVLDKVFRGFFVKRMIVASSLVGLSGVLMVFMQTSWSAVVFDWQSWSTLLLVKIILTVAMLSLALFQTLKWSKVGMFKTFQLIRMEWLIGLVILFFGVWLSQIMYPIAVKSYDEVLTASNVDVTVAIDKLQTGNQDMVVSFVNNEGDLPDELVVHLSMPDHGMHFGPYTSVRQSDGSFLVELPFRMPGKWEFKIQAELLGGDRAEWIDELIVAGE